jgi:hypothetical protein
MRYLSIYIPQQPTKPIVVIDLNQPNRLYVTDAIYYADHHAAKGFISNYQNIFKAKPQRRVDTGEIKLCDLPQRLQGQELLLRLEAMLARGKDKQPRQMHPNSLANLCTAPRFTRTNRPCKRSKFTEAQLDEAIRLRKDGFPWRMLGDRYGVNHDTLRLAVRDRGRKCHIGC